MPLFDPEMFAHDEAADQGFTSVEPGTYDFIVDEAVARTKAKGNEYRSGNEGVALTLLVGTKERDVPVFAHLVNTPKAAWKIQEFGEAVGLDMASVESPREIVNAAGKAEFVLDEKGYLTAKKFLPKDISADKSNGNGKQKAAAKAGNTELPF